MNNTQKPIASSPSVEGLQKLLNEYFFSTSYVIDPDTLKVSNSVGECPHITVIQKNKRFKAVW
jgi:hypothetical protein